MTGRLVVISGPSGVGKTTISEALLEQPGFDRVVTATSRPPRPGERDGIDYRFITEEAFRDGIDRDEFLETARVHGHLYGTPRDQVEEGLRKGKTLLLVIDVQGARRVRESARASGLPLTTFFIEPPSMEELSLRLSKRGTEDPAALERRLRTARAEMEERGAYEHIVVNDDLAHATREILEILGRKPDGGKGPGGSSSGDPTARPGETR